MKGMGRFAIGIFLVACVLHIAAFCFNVVDLSPWCDEWIPDICEVIFLFLTVPSCLGIGISWLAGCFDEEEGEDSR